MMLGDDQSKKKKGIAPKISIEVDEENEMRTWLCSQENLKWFLNLLPYEELSNAFSEHHYDMTSLCNKNLDTCSTIKTRYLKVKKVIQEVS